MSIWPQAASSRPQDFHMVTTSQVEKTQCLPNGPRHFCRGIGLREAPKAHVDTSGRQPNCVSQVGAESCLLFLFVQKIKTRTQTPDRFRKKKFFSSEQFFDLSVWPKRERKPILPFHFYHYIPFSWILPGKINATVRL